MSATVWFTAKEAAAYVHKTYKGFDHWVRAYGVPFVRVGRHRRFSQQAIDRVMQHMAMRRSA